MTTPSRPAGRAAALAHWLALNRTVGVVLLAVLLFGLGEQLWSGFLPFHLAADAKRLSRDAGSASGVPGEALALIGLYVLLRCLFECFCYLAGGQMTARLGDRGSLLLIGGVTLVGYTLFLCSTHPWAAVLAALLILGWDPLSVPVTFTTVGATLDPSRRGMAFALQSIQKRLPRILGPLLAGFVLGWAVRSAGDPAAGSEMGMRLLVGGALALGVGSILFQLRFMPHRAAPPPGPPAGRILRELHPALRRLLLAEVFTRFCDNLAREFVVLYAVLVLGASLEAVGALLALQHLTALLTYLPVGRMTRAVGLQPFVGVSFVCFALFPLALALCPGPEWLPLVFVLNGLREIGEPARKAIITTHFPEPVRARGVGLYWGLRSLCVAPAGLAGAALWWFAGPRALLLTAFVVGALGAGVYYAWGRAAGRADTAKTATGSLTAPPGPQYEQERPSALPPTPSPAPGGVLPPPT